MKVGLKFMSSQREWFTIIEYYNSHSASIQFEDERKTVLKKIPLKDIKNKKVKNPYFPSIQGIGYIGEGESRESVYKFNTHPEIYKRWVSILIDCKKSKFTIHKDWENFQLFAKWFEQNQVNGFEFSKKFMNNEKFFGPETCFFLPKKIINIPSSCIKRSEFLKGVRNHFDKFRAQLNGEIIDVCNTEEEAFNTYKKEKEEQIKSLALKWKNLIPEKVYNYLNDFKISET